MRQESRQKGPESDALEVQGSGAGTPVASNFREYCPSEESMEVPTDGPRADASLGIWANHEFGPGGLSSSQPNRNKRNPSSKSFKKVHCNSPVAMRLTNPRPPETSPW